MLLESEAALQQSESGASSSADHLFAPVSTLN